MGSGRWQGCQSELEDEVLLSDTNRAGLWRRSRIGFPLLCLTGGGFRLKSLRLLNSVDPRPLLPSKSSRTSVVEPLHHPETRRPCTIPMNEADAIPPIPVVESSSMMAPPSASFRDLVTDSIRYWEPRRLLYNAVLAVVVIGYWIAGSSVPLSLDWMLVLFVLAVLANLCYCAAYIADLFAQYSRFQGVWRRWRWLLFMLGVVFAAVITRFFALGLIGGPNVG